MLRYNRDINNQTENEMTSQAIATIKAPEFVVFSKEFGYQMWAADVPEQPDVEITDQPHEMAIFGNALAAMCMAKALTYNWGYKWEVLTCVS